MMNIIITLVLLLLTSACAAVVQPEQPCTARMTIQYWENHVVNGELRELDRTQKVLFLSRFNSVIPVSDYNPKHVYLLFAGSLTYAIFKGDSDCLELINPIPTTRVIEWFSKGTPA